MWITWILGLLKIISSALLGLSRMSLCSLLTQLQSSLNITTEMNTTSTITQRRNRQEFREIYSNKSHYLCLHCIQTFIIKITCNHKNTVCKATSGVFSIGSQAWSDLTVLILLAVGQRETQKMRLINWKMKLEIKILVVKSMGSVHLIRLESERRPWFMLQKVHLSWTNSNLMILSKTENQSQLGNVSQARLQ